MQLIKKNIYTNNKSKQYEKKPKEIKLKLQKQEIAVKNFLIKYEKSFTEIFCFL